MQVRGHRLKNFDFTDLMISESNEVQIRGLKNAKGPLIVVPDGVILDIAEFSQRVIRDGQVEDDSYSVDHDGIRYRVTKITSVDDTWYTIRKTMWPIPQIKDMGWDPDLVKSIGSMGKAGASGMILISGPTGSGKTTSAYSIFLQFLRTYGDVGITIEDPPESRLEGKHGKYGLCLQNKVRNGNISEVVRQVLRQTPRYILLGEIRDPEAAAQVLRAAGTGHVVISTVHAGSISEAINSLLMLVATKMDPALARNLVSEGLSMVMHQKMVTVRSSDDRTTRLINTESLVISGGNNEKGIRSKIRDGNIHQIENEIESQKNKRGAIVR